MTILSDIDLTINWEVSPRIITVTSGSTEISVQDLIDTCMYRNALPANMDDAILLESSGKEYLRADGSIKVGLTVTLNNAKIAFEARPGPTWILCDINGGNVVAVEDIYSEPRVYFDVRQPTAYVSVDKTASSSATLLEGEGTSAEDIAIAVWDEPLTEHTTPHSTGEALMFTAYQNAVWLDTGATTTGIAYPAGTRNYPVGNLTEAAAIALNQGFDIIQVLTSMSLDSGTDIRELSIVGRSPMLTDIVITSDAVCSGIRISDCNVNGTLDGGTHIDDCFIGNLDYVNGYIQNSGLYGTIALDGGATQIPGGWYDDFTAVSGSAPDPTKWLIGLVMPPEIATFDIQNNKLEFSIDEWIPMGQQRSIQSINELSGDFEVQIDWSLPTPPVNMSYFWFEFDARIGTGPSAKSAYLRYMDIGGATQRYYVSFDDDVKISQDDYATADLSGKFKIKRESGVFTFWVYSNGQWEWNGNTDGYIGGYLTDDGFKMTILSSFTMSTGLDVEVVQQWDNFIADYGGVLYDDFTAVSGSAPDVTKWEIVKDFYAGLTGSSEIQSNQLLHTLTAPSAWASGDILTKTNVISGDFDITVDWEIDSGFVLGADQNADVKILLFKEGESSRNLQIAYLTRAINSKFSLYQESPWNSASYNADITSSKFRLKRVGSTITGWVWYNDQWEWDGDTDGYTFGEFDTPVRIALSTRFMVQTTFPNTFDTYFDNFLSVGSIDVNTSLTAVISDCFSSDQNSPPIIDMGGIGQNLSMPNYSGLATIKNLTSATEEVNIGLDAGIITLDSTITSGTITIAGIGTCIDNTTGAYVNTDSLLSRGAIADVVWDEALTEHTVSGTFGKAIADIESDTSYISDIKLDTTDLKIDLERALGLMQENQYIDNTSYNSNGSMISGRLRTYTTAGSVGTDNDVLATYTITAVWTGTSMDSYKVVKV